MEFPVRVRIAAVPDEPGQEAIRRWLQRHVGTGNYAATPGSTWSHRGVEMHFRDLHTAQQFLLGNPHVQLLGERHDGPTR